MKHKTKGKVIDFMTLDPIYLEGILTIKNINRLLECKILF